MASWKILSSCSKVYLRQSRSYLITSQICNKNNNEIEKIDLDELLKQTRKPIATRPKVNLTSTKGITIKHINKNTRNSALLTQCLELEPNIDGFTKAVEAWLNNNKYRRGHMEFIATAMKFIEPYGLGKDIEVYIKLMDVFPREKFVNRTIFDAVWPKPHPQINLALDLLTKMEENGVIPTMELHDVAYDIFGRSSFPVQKINRMYFWFMEVKDLNPYSLPDEVYKDRISIMKAAVDRILGNNKGTQIIELSDAITDVTDMKNYEHFIVSSQTSKQREYFKLCTPSMSLYVEGPLFIWINHVKEQYFVLKSGRGTLESFEWTKIDVDEQREGVVLAICFASKPYTETLQRWITHLEESNPILKQINVIFDIQDGGETNSNEQPYSISAS